MSFTGNAHARAVGTIYGVLVDATRRDSAVDDAAAERDGDGYYTDLLRVMVEGATYEVRVRPARTPYAEQGVGDRDPEWDE